MKDTIATASKNVLRIKARKYFHKGFRAFQEVGRLINDSDVSSSPSSLVFYPVVRTGEELGDLLNRLGWYLPAGTVDDCRITIGTTVNEPTTSSVPDGQTNYPADHLPLQFVAPDSLDTIAREADVLLLWQAKSGFSPAAIRNLPRVEFVDPDYYSTIEPDTWARVGDAVRGVEGNPSNDQYRALERQASDWEEAYVFATGPSLDRAMEFEFPDDSLKVICNSIVRDDELLAHIEPDVLVFADPVFHFGPSEYANEFRQDAVNALENYDCVGVVPPRYRSLLTGHFPDLNLVSIESRSRSTPVFPTANNLEVMSTGNIMTLYMLPIASALANDVYIIGADGREEDESYFWEHNESAQYDEKLMKTVVDSHPSFFRDRVYQDYYQRHVETLTEMLEYGEGRGINYYSLTDSYVPCLADRTVSSRNP